MGGWEHVHVAIDDATRVEYVELLPDEGQRSTTGFVGRAIRYSAQRGIAAPWVMTDNGSGYRAKMFRTTLAAAGIRHLLTRPYTPRTNGKAERFIRTLLTEWAYPPAYRTSAARPRLTTITWLLQHRPTPHRDRRAHAPATARRDPVNNALINNS
ncbi:MAG TPA: DDE-type integrase/transposase/recombinase [Gemmatimonadaceae bacterium]|nr:DDE-type integrase/transposase/recombinase [Gemmatimonadaceae bacterium]